MLSKEKTSWQDQKQYRKTKKRKSYFVQLIGEEGSGSRRVSLSFLKSFQKVIWISSFWKIYAPLLWKEAEQKNIFLFGLECAERRRWRELWRELHETQAFDVWVLDYLRLRPGELFFLNQLLLSSPTQLLFLDSYPYSFCQERVHLSLSHFHYKLQWTKGNQLSVKRIAAEYLSKIKGGRGDLCLR